MLPSFNLVVARAELPHQEWQRQSRDLGPRASLRSQKSREFLLSRRTGQRSRHQRYRERLLTELPKYVLLRLHRLVRHKAKEIVEFLQDDDRLRDERKKAKANRDKYIGVSSDSSTHRYSRFHAWPWHTLH